MNTVLNIDGAVLVTSLLIMSLLTVLGLGSIFMANTEVKISGNLKTSSMSLYVAEGGLEAVRSVLATSAGNNMTINPSASNLTMTGFTYDTNCDTDVSNPCSIITSVSAWLDVTAGTTWYQYDSAASPKCTSTKITGISEWPVCRNITVGDDNALVTINRPSWYASAPTKVFFRQIVSEHTSSLPNKKVEANFEIDFKNNILVFQTFRKKDTTTTVVDNLTSPDDIVISADTLAGKYVYDYAIGGNGITERITGIYTGDSVELEIQVYNGASWSIYGYADRNASNFTTFMLGAADKGCLCAGGGVCNPPALGVTFTNGYKYKVVEAAAKACP